MSRKITALVAASLLATGLAASTALTAPTGATSQLASGSGCCAR
jgi:hypothetical protein